MKRLLAVALLTACAHTPKAPKAAQPTAAAKTGSVQVEDAIHGVRYLLPPGEDGWQVNREGEARSASGVETEVSSFPMARPTTVPHFWQISPHLYKFRGPNFYPNFCLVLADSGHALAIDCGLFDEKFSARQFKICSKVGRILRAWSLNCGRPSKNNPSTLQKSQLPALL